METKKTAVIYARQSFGSEVQSISIDNQIENCKRCAEKNGYQVVGIFSDKNTSSELYPYTADGVEASKIDKGFQRWLSQQITANRKEYKENLGKCFDFIQSNKVNVFICDEMTRLYREADNSYLGGFINSFFIENGVELVEAKNSKSVDLNNDFERLVAMIKSQIEYTSLKHKRINSMASVSKRINSFKVVSNAFGVIASNGIISFDADKAKLIKYIYDEICSGATYPAILNTMNKDYIHLAKGKQFYTTNLTSILNNMVYCGYAKNKSGEIQRAINIPEPIISFAQFQQVQKIINTKKASFQKYNLSGQKKRHFLPFSGYLYCECGRRLTVQFDNGIVYKCINADGHNQRIRLNAENQGQDFLTSIQSLFIINAIQSRKNLEANKTINNKIDEIKAQIASREKSYKAKFRMIADDADFELLKDDIEAIKKELAELKKDLLMMESQRDVSLDAISAKIETDFAMLMNGEKLAENDYQRLLADTINNIIVEDDSIKINLKDGNCFTLPRIIVDGRGKKILPYSDIYSTTDDAENIDSAKMHHLICFYCGEHIDGLQGAETLVKTDDYSILLYR